MTMTGVVLSVTLSGVISFFVSVKFLKKRLGLSLALIFLGPILSCGTYIYLTAPRFNAPILEPTPIASLEDIKNLQQQIKSDPDNIKTMFSLAQAYMDREDYDAGISFLKSKMDALEKLDAGEQAILQLTTIYFAKGLLFAEKGQYQSALDTLNIALETAPKDVAFLPDLKHFIGIIETQINTSVDGPSVEEDAAD